MTGVFDALPKVNKKTNFFAEKNILALINAGIFVVLPPEHFASI